MVSWTSISDLADGATPDQDDLNVLIDNLIYLKNDRVRYHAYGDASGDYQTTSTSFTNIGSPFSVTDTFEGGLILVAFKGTVDNSSNNYPYMAVTIDGTIVSEQPGGQRLNKNGTYVRFNTIFQLYTITAGSRTVALQWKIDGSGTLTLRNNTTDGVPMFYVREVSWTP